MNKNTDNYYDKTSSIITKITNKRSKLPGEFLLSLFAFVLVTPEIRKYGILYAKVQNLIVNRLLFKPAPVRYCICAL